MSEARQNLVDRTRFLFAVPSSEVAVLASLGVAVATGVVAVGPSPTGVGAGLLVIGVPAVLAAAWTGPLDRARDGSFTAARSSLLALAAAVVVGTFVVAAVAVRGVLGGGSTVVVDAVLTAAAGTFAFRLLVLVAVSGPPLVARWRAASVQPLATVGVVLALAVVTGHSLVSGIGLVLTSLVAALYVGIVVGLVAFVDYGMTRDFGVSGFEFLHLFLEYVADRSRGVESMFTSLGRRVETEVSVLVIRAADGTEKARVVVPLAHPGPLPDVGGGTLPYRLAEAGEGVVFTPHGLAGHEYDLASQRDVDAVCAAADAAAGDVSVEATGTPPVSCRVGEATVRGQRLGDGAFLVSTFAPAATDDVAGDVGREALATASEALTGTVESASAAADGGPDAGDGALASRGERGVPLVSDAHNARPTDDVMDGVTLPGSARADALLEAVEGAAASLAASSRGDLRVGVATRETPFDASEGVGPLGVRVLATEVRGETAAYVLVDGNNMLPDVREAILDAVRESVAGVDAVSVATTDTHAVNHLNSTNYVGASLDREELTAVAVDAAAAAVDDLEPAAAGSASRRVDATVLGEGTIDEIAGFTDRIIPICGKFVLASSAFVTLVAAVLFWVATT